MTELNQTKLRTATQYLQMAMKNLRDKRDVEAYHKMAYAETLLSPMAWPDPELNEED